MRACQFCAENDPFANTVVLKKTLILKFKASLFFIFSLKNSSWKTMENAFPYILKAIFVLKIL